MSVRSGCHIPGAVNLPERLFHNLDQTIKSDDEILDILDAAGARVDDCVLNGVLRDSGSIEDVEDFIVALSGLGAPFGAVNPATGPVGPLWSLFFFFFSDGVSLLSAGL